MTKPNFKLSKRMVSARFWSNDELAELADKSQVADLELTMIGLWAFADEAGIFEWKPRVAAGLLYPTRPSKQANVEPAMNAMVEAGFLKKIEVGCSWYGYWPNWGEHNDFRNNASRYPDVASALGYPCKGASTLKSPQRPSEVEGEVEGEALPPTQTTKQESDSVSGGQEKTNPPASSSDGGPAERLSRLLFKLLDQPRDQIKNAGVWEVQVAALLKTQSEEEIAAVMEYGVNSDRFAAEFLSVAKEPMKSFVKNYDNIRKGWKALQKGAAAAANREAKLAKKVSAPGSHGNQSGMEL